MPTIRSTLRRLEQALQIYDIDAEPLCHTQLLEQRTNYDCFWIGGVQNPGERGLLNDAVVVAQEGGVQIIPSCSLVICHENKVAQELVKQRLGIIEPVGEACLRPNPSCELPYVYKTADGSGSRGVSLVENRWTQWWLVLREACLRTNMSQAITSLKGALRYLTLPRSKRTAYWEQKRAYYPAVVQQFVAGLDSDFKVLVFGDRFYCLKRFTRKNDFRASGSGDFEPVSEANESLLDYAQSIYAEMRSPCLSLDIAIDRHGVFYLIEFQAIHFGPTTVYLNETYFRLTSEGWQTLPKDDLVLEELYAYGLTHFLCRMHQRQGGNEIHD